jgi:NADH:ubiquinone oxidoreductase subunit F (NADH-binding)
MNESIVLIRNTSSEKMQDTNEFYQRFKDTLNQSNLQKPVSLVRALDLGVYKKGNSVRILPQNIVYTQISDDDIKRIITATLKQGKIIKDLQFIPKAKQKRIVLRNCGRIDPESIKEYKERDGYIGLEKALNGSSQQVIDELKESKLRGRGGGGFPTWRKWTFALKQDSDQKYVICNADEGDPGAYMDRSLLEGDPHAVLEGIIIAGYAVGASQGYFYIRAEYPLAIKRVNHAIKEAKKQGYLGKNILGSDFSFDVEVRLGAGAFVCGEETALIASLEGKRGTPRPRPPYPSVKGLWDKPTVINNVETLANVPYILTHGGETYAKIGTDDSTGTKVFAVTGKVHNSGLVEVPMGTTLRQIVFDICGGLPTGRTIKAVQTGGPSGGVIPEQYLDTPVEYGTLQKLGSIMGSGGMIVIDDTDCVVDLAKFYLKFCVDESCGKCAPCRLGGYQMLRILEKITEGTGSIDDLDKLSSIAKAMSRASLCGLGQTAPNPVVSTMHYFPDEYTDHIQHHHCPAGVCKSLMTYEIIQENCRRCGVCQRVCPADAISGDREKGYLIDLEKCTKCGSCYDACKFDAIRRD